VIDKAGNQLEERIMMKRNKVLMGCVMVLGTLVGYSAWAAVSTNIAVNASDYLSDTGVYIPANGTAVVTTAGSWDVCGGACPSGPEGSADGFTGACPGVEGRPAGELIGSLDGGETFFPIGAGPTPVQGPGQLLVTANDCGDYGDNFGQVAGTVVVRVVPTTSQDCKNGGWRYLERLDGTGFNNQGDCVSYVQTGN
jgi:hypothetical protein